MSTSLKFGDPESIALRDKARVEAEAQEHECATCFGEGVVTAHFYCEEKNCCGGRTYRHDVETGCPCCEGTGRVDNEYEEV